MRVFDLNSPASYFYDDYTYANADSGSLGLANQLYAYGEVSGALVNEGHHAMVFKGATTSCNLDLDSCWISGPTISTVYVDDPWFNWNTNTPGMDADGCPGTGGSYKCGKIGLQPNSAISYSTWKSFYYTPWGHQPSQCSYWNGKWVSVLRKPTSSPPTAPVVSGAPKDLTFGAPTPDPEPGVELTHRATAAAPLLASSQTVGELDRTFQIGKVKNGRRIEMGRLISIN